MNQEKIGKLIANLRKEKKLTQEQLGEKVGVNGKAVSKWECGISLPDISIVNKLADILGVTTTELLNGQRESSVLSNESVLKNIRTYIKKNCIYLLIILFGSILCGCMLNYFLQVNCNYELYNFRLNEKEFSINGYIAKYPDRSLFIVDELLYQGDLLGVEDSLRVSQLKVSFLKGDEFIYNYIIPETYEDKNKVVYFSLEEMITKIDFNVQELRKKYDYTSEDINVLIEVKTDNDYLEYEYDLDPIIIESTCSYFK